MRPALRHLAAALFLVPLPAGIAAGQCAPPAATAATVSVPPDTAFVRNGRNVPLARYAGHKLMLWQVATWCSSCKAGLRTLERHRAEIDASGTRVLILRAYGNAGYPGIGIRAFAAKVAPGLLKDPHFVFGDDTKALYDATNPLHAVDLYHLIAADGRIVATGSAPSATYGTIARFLK
jgi:hypothetical protein